MRRKTAYDILFILLLACICHFLFSPLGFNPTDEGFVLSASERVLHGQIPHVDFSSVRPLGYAYLHIPELLISHTWLFLVSRFVFWLETILIAFLWIRFCERIAYGGKRLDARSFYLLAVTAFIFNVHYFPCSVLHTIDGLLCCIIGLNCIAAGKRQSLAGFFLVGFAALCKQNYLIVLPAALLLFNRNNFFRNLLAGLLPLAAYITFIALHHGLNDLIVQLTGHNELLEVGIKKYVLNYFFYLGILSVVAMRKLKLPHTLFISAILGILSVLMLTGHYHGSMSFMLTGILAAEWIYTVDKKIKLLILTTALFGWCVSISVGYNTPALFAGGCLSLLIMIASLEKKNVYAGYSLIWMGLLAGLFYFVRTHYIYRDAVSSRLTYSLSGIVEGANGIYTNRNTYSVLKELDSLKKVKASLIAIPDFTTCNILHAHLSPVKTEWPNKTEIPNRYILSKVLSGLQNRNPVFAIPKYQTALLKDGFIKLPKMGYDYPIVAYVKQHYRKTGTTKYFELYEK
jgi:hypothetical protein